MNNKKRTTAIGVGVLVLLTLGAGGYYFMSAHPNMTKPLVQSNLKLVRGVLAYNADGAVSLYDTSSGKVLSTFNLKTLNKDTPVTVSVAKSVTEPPKPITTERSRTATATATATGTFHGFEELPVTFKAGDVAWWIQARLTPKENTANMIALDRELNGSKSLDLVYPGEARMFLEQKSAHPVQPIGKPPVTTSPTTSPTSTPAPTKITVAKGYMFYPSTDGKTLYAYNDNQQTLYQLTAQGSKVNASVVLSIGNIQGVTSFKVVNQVLYLVMNGGSTLRAIDLNSTQKATDYTLLGTPDTWMIEKDILYYTYQDKLVKENLLTDHTDSIEIGSKAESMRFVKGSLFLLTDFASNVNNSVLVKVDPSTMKVDNLTSLNSNQDVIYTLSSNEGALDIGQANLISKSSNKVENTPVVLPVNVQSLSLGTHIGGVPFSLSGQEFDGNIYELQGGVLSVYRSDSGNKVTHWSVGKATDFMLLS